MRRFPRAICSALIAAACAFPRTSEAGEPPLALGPVSYEGEIPEFFQREVEQTLVDALENSHGAVLELRVSGCRQIDCLLEPARAAKTAAILLARVRKQDRDYQVEFIAYAVDDGSVLAQVSAQCSICGQRELLDSLPAELAKLRARTLEALSERTLPPRLAVDGTPTGARLRLDGEEVGTSPLATDVATGEHALEISAPGHAAQVHRWLAVANVEELVRFELEPIRTDRSTGKGLRAGGWFASGAGVAGIAAGATLVVFDGRPHQPTCPSELLDVNGACPNVYTTATAGYTILAAGVVSLGVGIGLLVRGYRQRERAAQVRVAPGGVQLRF